MAGRLGYVLLENPRREQVATSSSPHTSGALNRSEPEANGGGQNMEIRGTKALWQGA